MRILGLDFETTGLDPNADVITEVGAVIWDTERRCPILIDNYFVWDGQTILSDLIIRITGIQQRDLEEFGLPEREGFARLFELMDKVEVVVAHNGNIFDKRFYKSWCDKWLSDAVELKELPWIDTLHDIDYPEHCASRKLGYLGADHGFLNPFSHRAVFDVLTMMKVLDNYNIEEVVASSKEPKVLVEAIVSFQDKDLAKAKGFKWEKQRWVKTMKVSQTEQFPFRTRIVQ